VARVPALLAFGSTTTPIVGCTLHAVGARNPERLRRWVSAALAVGGTVALAIVVARTAWVCDDAYVTLRSVDQLLAGNGLVWNLGQRVQVFTHPLWAMLLVPWLAVTGSASTALLGLSALGVAAAWVGTVLPLRDRPSALAVATAGWLGSRAIVDYATSGLEEPLSYVLLTGFLAVWYAEGPVQLRVLGGIAGVAAVTRLDSGLLLAPCLAVAAVRAGWREGLAGAAFAAGPPAAWMAFSVGYFGFALPNTAYAKLGHGVPQGEMLVQGLAYLRNSLRTDPVTLPACALAAALAARGRHWPVAAGIGLQLAYVVWVGGDFMAGRFLAVPALAAVLVVARAAGERPPAFGVALALVGLGTALAGPYPSLTSGPSFGAGRRTWGDLIDLDGIADERAFWFACAGALSDRRPPGEIDCRRRAEAERRARDGERVVVSGGVGFLGYWSAHDVVIVDPMAITDPLLARLESPIHDRALWRPGHHPRELPEGYVETLATGENHLGDPAIAAYWRRLDRVVSGDLLDPDRLAAIAEFAVGRWDGVLPVPEPVEKPSAVRMAPRPVKLGARCTDQRMAYYRQGLVLTTGERSRAGAVRLAANDDAEYRLDFVRGGRTVGSVTRAGDPSSAGRMVETCHPLPASVVDGGFDRVALRWVRGDKSCFGQLVPADACP
jgi:arabinofuranosyltransferase